MNTARLLAKDDAARLCEQSGSPASSTALPCSNQSWLAGGTAVLDRGGKIVRVDDSLATWLGTVPDQLEHQHFSTVLGQRHPEWTAVVPAILTSEKTFERAELVAPTEKGAERIALEVCSHENSHFIRLESLLPPAGELEELFPEDSWGRAVTHSILHRLLRAEAQLDNLNRRWPGILFSQRPDFTFSNLSPGIETLTGVSTLEWQRQSCSFWHVVHEEDAAALRERLSRVAGSPDGLSTTYRIRHARTGRIVHLWEHRKAVHSANGLLLGWEGIWLDITRQTTAERRLLTMSWKENLGTLTMGLAHDFCNVMAGIVGLSETFEDELGDNETLRGGLSLIRTSAVQAGQLSHQIRRLHQGVPGQRTYEDLNEVLQQMTAVLERVLTRRITVKAELAPGQLPVFVDAVELRQVIVNFALNAAEAMAEGGRLTFITSQPDQPPRRDEVHGVPPRSPLVRLSVRDTGEGIPACHLQRIFEPFFSTKPMAKGSGLGLYNARVFAEKHGAAITVESREKEGSTFHLWLSRSDLSESETVEQTASRARHTLVAFGPAGQRLEEATGLLRKHGFYVVTASSEAELLPLLHSPEYEISGVLMLRDDDARLFELARRVRVSSRSVKLMLELPRGESDQIDDFLARNPGVTILTGDTSTGLLDQVNRAVMSNLPEVNP